MNTLKKLLFPLIMWSIIALFYSYQYLLQVSPGAMAEELMNDLRLNATELGTLAACYFYTYAGMQIPVGIIIDRYDVRKPLSIAAAICALGALIFGYAHNLPGIALGRLMIGCGGAFAVVSSLYVAANWLPIRYFTALSGSIVTLGMIGAIFGQYPLATMVDNLSWRSTMLFFGIMGIIITTLIWGFTRNRPNANHAKPHVLTGLKYILKNSQIWLLAIYGGLMFMSISILGSLWGTPFLMAKYQITNTAASANLSSLFIGLGIGCPLLCWISDHFERRKIIMFIASFGTLISIIPVLYFAIPYWLTAVLLCGLGFFMGGFLVSFNLAREVQSTGAAMGFMNTINMVGGALMQSVCGLIMDLMHPNSIAKGQKIYTLLDFQVALSIVPLTTIIALIMLYWINERN